MATAWQPVTLSGLTNLLRVSSLSVSRFDGTLWSQFGFKRMNPNVEIKTIQMRTSKDYLSRACSSKGVSHHHLCLAEAPRQAREWESFTVGKRKKKKVLGMDAVGMGKLEAG